MNATLRACNATEVEFLLLYREADRAGRRRLTKALNAARAGLLPSAERIKAMSREEAHAFLDALSVEDTI